MSVDYDVPDNICYVWIPSNYSNYGVKLDEICLLSLHLYQINNEKTIGLSLAKTIRFLN